MTQPVLAEKKEYTSAVAIVRDRDRWLLGLSRADDDRKGRWCMPGGHIKGGEALKKAAERECWEETGIRVKATSDDPIKLDSKRGVVFILCKPAKSGQSFKPNSEFAGLGWFKESEMYQLKLFGNVRELIKLAKK